MSQCANCGGELQGTPRFCPTCGSPVDAPAKEMLSDTQTGAKSKTRRIALVFLPIVLLAGIGVFIAYINPSVNAVIQKQPVVASPADYDSNFVEMATVSFREEGNDLVFSLADLKQYRLVRFEYKTATMTRPLMAYVAPDGRLVTAISVSEHCGSTEFKIKDNKIYCAHCPSYWDMMTMEAFACCAQYYPDPIPSKVIADEVHIARDVVEKWAGRL
jgi:hypothetical protein